MTKEFPSDTGGAALGTSYIDDCWAKQNIQAQLQQ